MVGRGGSGAFSGVSGSSGSSSGTSTLRMGSSVSSTGFGFEAMPFSMSLSCCISCCSCCSCGSSTSGAFLGFCAAFFRGFSGCGAGAAGALGGSGLFSGAGCGAGLSGTAGFSGAAGTSALGWGKSVPGSAVRRVRSRSSGSSPSCFARASAPSSTSPVGSSRSVPACGACFGFAWPNSRPNSPFCSSAASSSRRTISAGISATVVVKKSRNFSSLAAALLC